MDRTISVSGVPKRVLQYLVAGGVVLLALWGAVQVLALAAPGVDVLGTPPLLATLAGLWIALTWLWVRSAGQGEDGGSWWGPVPSRQYTGRFAGGGGIARDSWEKALPGSRDDGDD